MSVEFIVKFKKEIWVILFAGIVLLIVASLVNPDLIQQITSILTLFGVLFIVLFISLVMLKYWEANR